METLRDLLSGIRRLDAREALRDIDRYRTRTLSYGELYGRIGGFARLLDKRGIGKGDRVLIWGENRAAWVTAFWGCVARGAAAVPLDFRSSPLLARRVQGEVRAKLLVHGDAVEARAVDAERLSFDAVDHLGEVESLAASPISPDDIVEIVYTSGTTGDPKGVVHRHRNICANLRAFQKGFARCRPYLRPFQPIRVLDLLPLSHMFGQSLGIYMPVLLEGSAVFMRGVHPGAILEAIREERISALVLVPRLLLNLQREVSRRFDVDAHPDAAGFLKRVWRFRRLHTATGWKFWFLVVGGARVDPGMEAFWSRMGFVVVQGYGLTEASPVVAFNHPFRTQAGSLGRVLNGQEVKIAPDGEILVRGESVVSEYFGRAEEVTKDGWVHTGDIGEMDAEGRLYYRGRKKEIIVTSEGLNVYPQDVEAVLDRLPEVRESAVVGLPRNGEEKVHAVFVLSDPSADPGALVRRANGELEPHQRIRSWSIWPEECLPRTPSTFKIKHREVADRLAGKGDRTGTEPDAGGIEGMLSRLTGRTPQELKAEYRLAEDLGLSSLDRVDLLSELEAYYGVGLDETGFARLATVGDLKLWMARMQGDIAPGKGDRTVNIHQARPAVPPAGVPERKPAMRLPRWPRSLPVRWTRTVALDGVLLPVLRLYMDLSVEGVAHLRDAQPPLLFAANHTSAFDVPAILIALPAQWRRRVVPAITQDYFRAYFHPEQYAFWQRAGRAVQFHLACGLFNAFPLPQGMDGMRQAFRYMGEAVDDGFCPLVFPEGRRTDDGNMQPFRPGIGLMALRLRVPVVPIHLDGLFEVLPVHRAWPRRGPVRVRIGRSISLSDERDYRAAAHQIEQAIVDLAAGSAQL